MKERYETPEMEIVEFETEDIITASNDLPPMGIDNSIKGLCCRIMHLKCQADLTVWHFLVI